MHFDHVRRSFPIRLPEMFAKHLTRYDLARMPHLLIAGATGTGKSVCINSILVSLLYNHFPQDLRFILIDPKMLELSMYENIPHLMAPVVTNAKRARGVLWWAVEDTVHRERLTQRRIEIIDIGHLVADRQQRAGRRQIGQAEAIDVENVGRRAASQ